MYLMCRRLARYAFVSVASYHNSVQRFIPQWMRTHFVRCLLLWCALIAAAVKVKTYLRFGALGISRNCKHASIVFTGDVHIYIWKIKCIKTVSFGNRKIRYTILNQKLIWKQGLSITVCILFIIILENPLSIHSRLIVEV